MPNVIGDTPYPICVHKLVPNFNFSAFGRSTISKIRNGDDDATRAESWEMRNGKVFSLAGVMGDACIERAERTGVGTDTWMNERVADASRSVVRQV